MGYEFDADVRERWGRGPRRHDKEGGRGRDIIVLANWGLEKG